MAKKPKKRRKPMTPAEMGRKGARNRNRNLTPEQRSEIARRGAEATNRKRWGSAPEEIA